jgi:tetratricopeptide (TPR) repeat protein
MKKILITLFILMVPYYAIGRETAENFFMVYENPYEYPIIEEPTDTTIINMRKEVFHMTSGKSDYYIKEKALELLQKDVSTRTNAEILHYDLYIAFMQMRRYAEAVDEATHCISLFPTQLYWKYLKAMGLFRMGDNQEALSCIKDAKDDFQQKIIHGYNASDLGYLVMMKCFLGLKDEALNDLDHALKEHPNDLIPSFSNFYSMVRNFDRNRDVEAFPADGNFSVEQPYGNHRIPFLMQFSINTDAKAIENYQEAMTLWSRDTFMGYLNSINPLKKAILQDKKFELAYQYLSEAYSLTGHTSQAIHVASECESLFPQHQAYWLLVKGLLMKRIGDETAANEAMQKAVALYDVALKENYTLDNLYRKLMAQLFCVRNQTDIANVIKDFKLYKPSEKEDFSYHCFLENLSNINRGYYKNFMARDFVH